MKTPQRLLLSALVALLALAAIGLVLTRSWVNTAQNQPAAPAESSNLVNERPLQTALQLAALAVSPAEQQYSQQALHFSDNEVDLTFDSALRAATEHPPALTPEGRDLQSRVQRREARVAAEQQNIARLTQLSAKAPPARKDELQQQLDLAQAQLSLDQDALDDARQDLIRAGGDPHSKIEQMLQEHEQSEVHKGVESLAANAATREAALENTNARSVVAQFRAWKSLSAKQQKLGAARSDALTLGAQLAKSHEALESQIAQQQKPASPQNPAGASAVSSAPPGDTAAAISRVRELSSEQKNLAAFDKRIEDEQALADTYSKWSAFVVSRERFFLRGLLVSVFWILFILLCVVLSDVLVRRFLHKLSPERKRFLTLRSVFGVATRTVGVILILLVILGMPSQFATVLALAGAGLTVALKDFIVGFFGWFVLMGANGIRPGDWVEINGVGGEVFEVGLLHTVLLETGNWSDAGHPTGRKVTFVNSFAIEGHYFNFSTSGQWMWDELQVAIPAGKNPYPIAEEIQKIVAKETEKNARLAEQEWERVTLDHGSRVFKAEPAMNLRPSGGDVSVAVRYITRASERHDLRARLYRSVLDLLHRKKIPQSPETLAPQSVPGAEE